MASLKCDQSFRSLASRFDEIAGAVYSKPQHLVEEFSDYLAQAALLLDRALDDGLYPPLRALRVKLMAGIKLGVVRYETPEERRRELWTVAISSWLAKELPEQLRGGAAELDWSHSYVKPGTEWIVTENGDEAGNLVSISKHIPDDAIVRVERDEYDLEDKLARLRRRAKNYADACRLLARLAESRDDSTDWVDATTIIKRGYVAAQGHLTKLAKRHPDVRRRATEDDRTRFEKPRLQWVWDARRIYDLTEGAEPTDTV